MLQIKLPHYFSIFLLILLLPLSAFSQSELVLPPYAESQLYLDAQIDADAGRPADRVYVLQDGIYLLGTVITNNGYTFRMMAENGARPVIYLYPYPEQTFPSHFLQMGGDAWLKDLIIVGYVEADTSQRYNNPPRMIRSQAASGTGLNITIDGCMLTDTRGEHLRFEADMGVVKIINCIFANQGDLNRSNLGAGKPIDFRNVAVDSAIIINNTFINFQDRIVRHLLSVGSLNYFRFEHNTAYNSMGYHGTLSLGFTGDQVIISNNLFLDTFIAGADTDATRQSEFTDPQELDPRNGLGKMFWVLSVPNDSTKWTVANNFYGVSDDVQAFYNDFANAGVLGEGPALTHHMNMKLGADSANAWTKAAVNFAEIPQPMVNLARWYRDPEGGNKTKNTPCTDCWDIDTDDFDRQSWQWFADTLDCSYSISDVAYTGAAGGFPAGDLNWFPTKKTEWETWVATAIEEPGFVHIAKEFQLAQNYPNPFNPITTISFKIARAEQVKLVIYNTLGQEVVTLIDQKLKAGEYSFNWNAADNASGVYFYKLHYGSRSDTKKMVLMK